MRASSPSLVLAAALVATACGDSSPASPFTGAATLAEESVGSSQSPINIRTERVNFVGPRGLPSLEFRYGRDVTLDVVNTGSPGEEATVRAEVPSKHRINGKEFPLEMHLVHSQRGGRAAGRRGTGPKGRHPLAVGPDIPQPAGA
jgi:hypothetical protein